MQLTREWPYEDGEIKGRKLAERHFSLPCNFLEPHQVIFECFAMVMQTTTEDEVVGHRAGQVTGMTSTLTSEHHPHLVREVHKLCDRLEKMLVQLPGPPPFPMEPSKS